MKKIVILGYGGRGRMYSLKCTSLLHRKDFELVAVIDNSQDKLNQAKIDHKLADSQLYLSLEDFCKQGKIADYMFVCTQDRQHRDHAVMALNAGYNLFLEKPIATSVEDCVEIARVANEKKLKVDVCHVLRYSGYYEKIREIIASGVLGKIIAIEQIENVAYWHQAHSYVRGDWRREDESNPMILAKCCHDLDTAVFMADSRCEYVTSTGELNYFNKANAPKGATEYCLKGCAAKENCPYDCEKLYIDKAKKMPKAILAHMWPQSRLMADGVVTIPKLYDACNNTRYGKCVFLSDNDVVDYQQTTMKFENGITSTLTMTAFSDDCYRETRIRGSLGELHCTTSKHYFVLHEFGKKARKVKIMLSAGGSHGGGDERMIKALADGTVRSDINMSIESHLIGFAAEMSRHSNGVTQYLKDFRKN